MMHHAAIDPSIQRQRVGDFDFPLGVYPVDPAGADARPGYVTDFEQADGDDSGDWEEWPDRYMFDIVTPHRRLESLCLALFSMLPGRVFPILDVLSEDAYREIDPYIAYEAVGFDRFLDEVRRYRAWFFEDGMVGFGAMSLDPFVYVFIDEHKIVTVRVETELKERVERLLASFEFPVVEELHGVDSTEHEHRSVLALELAGEEYASHAEIVERLRDRWMLSLNVDWENNTDDDGRVLGITAWRCDVRRLDDLGEEQGRWEVLLAAGSLHEAEGMAVRAVAAELALPTDDEDSLRETLELLDAVRLRPEAFAEAVGRSSDESFDRPSEPRVYAVRSWGG